MRFAAIAGILLLALSVSAFGQTIDPIGFCPPPGSITACTTATGLVQGGSQETIGIGPSTFAMASNGSGGLGSSPWYLLVALPNYLGAAPTFTSTGGFTQQGTTVNAGHWSSGDLYDFANTAVSGVNAGINQKSMSFTNLSGLNEQTALGTVGTPPSFFDVFVYTFTPGINSGPPPTVYLFNVNGSLPTGTFLAGAAGSNGFSTIFTTAGLVNGPGCTPSTCGGGGGGGQVPEPFSITLLATAGLIVGNAYRKRTRLN